MPRRNNKNNNDFYDDNSTGGNSGWFAVPGKAEKEAMMKERKQRKKEERRQEAETHRHSSNADDVYGNNNNNDYSDYSSYYTYQPPKVQEETTLSKADRLRNSKRLQEEMNEYSQATQHYQEAVLTVGEKKNLEKLRQKQEDEQARKKKEAELAAQRRRQLAQQRAAREKNPKFWPTLEEALLENAKELTYKLDALYDPEVNELTSQSHHLRVHYAVSIIQELLNNGRVKIDDDHDDEDNEDDNENDNETTTTTTNDILCDLIDNRINKLLKKENEEKISEVMDAIEAQGRSSKNLIEILLALDDAKVFSADHLHHLKNNNNNKNNTHISRLLLPPSCSLFAAKLILRGSADWTLENLDVALAHFIPKLLSKNQKESAHAELCLQFVWRTLIEDSFSSSSSSQQEAEENAILFAQVASGVARVLDSVQKLNRMEDEVVIRQVLWLVNLVSDVVIVNNNNNCNYNGPAHHPSVKSVLVGHEVPCLLISHDRVINDEDLAQKLLHVLRFVGPRHHANFTKMTLPVMIKKLSSSSANNNDNVEDNAIRVCGSLLLATADQGSIVPQANPTPNRLLSVCQSPLLTKILKSIVQQQNRSSSSFSIDEQIANDFREALTTATTSKTSSSSCAAESLSYLKKLKTTKIEKQQSSSRTTSASSAATSSSIKNNNNNNNKNTSSSSTNNNSNNKPPILPSRKQQQEQDKDLEKASFVSVILLAMVIGFCLWFGSILLRTPHVVDQVLKSFMKWIDSLDIEGNVIRPVLDAYFINIEKAMETERK